MTTLAQTAEPFLAHVADAEPILSASASSSFSAADQIGSEHIGPMHAAPEQHTSTFLHRFRNRWMGVDAVIDVAECAATIDQEGNALRS